MHQQMFPGEKDYSSPKHAPRSAYDTADQPQYKLRDGEKIQPRSIWTGRNILRFVLLLYSLILLIFAYMIRGDADKIVLIPITGSMLLVNILFYLLMRWKAWNISPGRRRIFITTSFISALVLIYLSGLFTIGINGVLSFIFSWFLVFYLNLVVVAAVSVKPSQ